MGQQLVLLVVPKPILRTFFVIQFPTKTEVEISPARFSDDGEKFVDHDLNIGWAMSVDNSYHVNAKKTNLKEVDTRPPTKEELIKTRKCLICNELVAWTKCNRIFHDYGSYSQQHLTQDQLEKVDELVKWHHAISANSGFTGITGGKNVAPDEDIEKISDILINKDRVKNELRASRIRNGLNIRTNHLFEEFTKIEDEFLDFINSAELVSKAQAMPFLKGCYMHWKQSVQKIVSNHAVVSPENAQHFLSLTYNMQRTTVDVVFDETVQDILREFPNSRLWVQWWLQPSISSTILSCRFLMKESLRQHDSRTSNAIESYHSALYRLIPKKKPLATSLRLLLQVCRREGPC
ncbi:hypothetical protein BD770DRAFT_478017 [Pilaira anomala]|nr:hypothetical protein BD770DRAFT_478017 [Pilaira anomala]